ncbi:MAG TPA: hypothetical protein VGF46_06880 [Gaiellales bacterium]
MHRLPIALAAIATVALAGALVASAASTPTPTAVGTVLKIGKPAIVVYQDPEKPKLKGTFQITPESIQQGSIKDFANITLDAKQKSDTPFYLKILTKDVGTTTMTKERPDLLLNGVDDRGQSQSSIIFFGDFARCGDSKAPTTIKPGQSYETCQAFLLAKGGSIKGAVWSLFDPKHPSKSDINWKK